MAFNPIWGFTWYFNTESWATGVYQKMTELRIDPWRAKMTDAVARVYGGDGASRALGGFRSRVAGVGPQVGFFLPVADRDGYLNLRGYYEFDAKNRLEGWTAYVMFSVEAAERKPGEARPVRPATFPR